MTSLSTCLWFDSDAEEAAQLYCDVLGGEIRNVSRYDEAWAPPGRAGQALTVDFTILDRDFMGLNGGPEFTPNPAYSTVVTVGDQAELDRVWDGLMAGGGQESQCGWLTDRFGFSWQVVPSQLGALMSDPERGAAVGLALQQMQKIDIATLESAGR
ncbi:VOC family protein [Mariniluteicoccus flavus]